MIKGIAATAMSDVMEVTRLSKGSLYVHFENKEELAQAVVAYNLEILGEKMNRALAEARTAKAKLHAYIRFFSTPVTPPVTGGCPLLNFGMEADDTDAKISRQVNTAVQYCQQLIASIIKKGIAEGEFHPDWDYRGFATLMFAMIEGGQLICRVAGSNSKMKVIAGALEKMIEAQTL